MLTARQMVTIATQSSVLPLRLSGLAKMYTVTSPLSLRTIANLMQQQKTYLEFEVRDISLLTAPGVTSYATLQAAWTTGGHPSRATLEQLSTMLSGAGASITYVSEYWHKVGIAGKLGALAGLNVYPLNVLTGASAPQSPQLRPQALTPEEEEWLAIGAFLMGAAAVLLIAPAGIGFVGTTLAMLPEPILIGTLSSAAATGLQALGFTVGVAGVVVGGVGVVEVVADIIENFIALPSGTNVNTPVDPETANAGVLTITDVRDAYGGYSAPTIVITAHVPADPPPTPTPGGTPPPTLGPGSPPATTQGPPPTTQGPPPTTQGPPPT